MGFAKIQYTKEATATAPSSEEIRNLYQIATVVGARFDARDHNVLHVYGRVLLTRKTAICTLLQHASVAYRDSHHVCKQMKIRGFAQFRAVFRWTCLVEPHMLVLDYVDSSRIYATQENI